MGFPPVLWVYVFFIAEFYRFVSFVYHFCIYIRPLQSTVI